MRTYANVADALASWEYLNGSPEDPEEDEEEDFNEPDEPDEGDDDWRCPE